MKLGMLLSFAAGFLAAVLLGFRAGPSSDCAVGDMGGALNTQTGKALEQNFGAWIHKARQCHVGDYLVIAPAAAGQSDILVGRNGKSSYVAVSDKRTLVVADGRSLYEWDRARKMITYAAYDEARKSWVENYDVNADGTIEVRTIDGGSAHELREVPASEQWVPLGSRDGRSGTILNRR